MWSLMSKIRGRSQSSRKRNIFKGNVRQTTLPEHFGGIKHFNADKFFTGANVQRDFLIQPHGTAFVIAFDEPDIKGVDFRVIADFHGFLLSIIKRVNGNDNNLRLCSLITGATCFFVYTCPCHVCPKGKLYWHKILSRFAGSREPFVMACFTSYSLAPRSLHCSLACCVNLIGFIPRSPDYFYPCGI